MPRTTIGFTFIFVLASAAVPQAAEFGTYCHLDPAQRHTDISGKLKISVSDPFIISSRISRPELGAHEQPHLFKMLCGDIHLVFHKDPDIDAANRVVLRSSDGGKTWSAMPISVHRYDSAGVLRDGTVLVYDDYDFRQKGNASVGQMCVSKDGGRTFGPVELAVFNRPANVLRRAMTPESAANYKNTSAQWSDQVSHALWRSVLELPDGSLIACAHTLGYEGDTNVRTIVYRSTDKGRTWGSEVTVASDRSVAGAGFVEPVMSFTSRGDVLCVMRTDGNLPLMQARSTDGGKTWGPYGPTGSLGVDPDLCLMSTGVLACSYGRPGVRVMFSSDGTGNPWSDRIQIYEYDQTDTKPGGSFGYTGIVEVEPGKLLLVYDRNDAYPEYNGRRTTAVQGVFITIKKIERE